MFRMGQNLPVHKIWIAAVLAPEAACLRLATRWERCGCIGRCRRRCWGLSQDSAACKAEAGASHISHISAASTASSIDNIAKADAADASVLRCTLLHQWPLRGLIVVATTSISCSCARYSGIIVKLTIAIPHCEAFVVAVIIAVEYALHLQLLLTVLWTYLKTASQSGKIE